MSEIDKHLEGFSGKKARADETVQSSVKGYVSGNGGKNSNDALMTGRLILTDQRVCFYRKGIIGEKFESINLSNITSIESSAILGHRSVKLYSTHNDLTFNSFTSKAVFDPVVAQIEQAMNVEKTSNHVPNANVNASSLAPAAHLEKLAALHKSGILTDEEFSAKKAEILARI